MFEIYWFRLQHYFEISLTGNVFAVPTASSAGYKMLLKYWQKTIVNEPYVANFPYWIQQFIGKNKNIKNTVTYIYWDQYVRFDSNLCEFNNCDLLSAMSLFYS